MHSRDEVDALAVAICDLNRELAERRAREFHIPSVYTNYEDIIARNAAVLEALKDH